jgi:hypothetical protein
MITCGRSESADYADNTTGKTESKHSHKKAQKAQNEINGRSRGFIQARFQRTFFFAPLCIFVANPFSICVICG